MSAFNARLKPKMLFGFPLWAIVGLILALASGLMTFLLPSLLLNVLTGVLCLYGLAMTVVSLAYGENLKFFSIKRLSRLDDSAHSVDVVTHE